MQIMLHLDGKEQIYVVDFVSARMLRRTIELSKTINFDDISVDELDTMAGYLVELFGKEFTVDQVYDGLSSKELIPALVRCIQNVVGDLNEVTTPKDGEGKNDQ